MRLIFAISDSDWTVSRRPGHTVRHHADPNMSKLHLRKGELPGPEFGGGTSLNGPGTRKFAD
jgi:hypothetical protein